MALQGKADIVSKYIKWKKIKIKAILVLVGIAIFVFVAILAAFDWQSNQSTAEALKKNMYEKALNEGGTDIAQLVEIKGNDSSGYYLEFVSDIDERLEKVIRANREDYEALGVKLGENHNEDGVATLKKFIKAQLSTEFPHLGARMSGGTGGATGSIDGEPDLSNRTLYPFDGQEGWCQWYATGRIRELYGIDIPSNPAVGSLGNYDILYDDWLCSEYSDYFEKSTEPAPGSVYCGKRNNHVGFIRAVDLDAGTLIIEDGNSLSRMNGTFIDWTSKYGIPSRQASGAGLAIHTMTIEAFKNEWDPVFCVPTDKAKALLKDANITDKVISTSNIDSLEGFLFIGDSITVGLRDYGGITDEGVQFRAVGSSSPQFWLDDKPVGNNPTFSSLPGDSDSITAICIMLGTNWLKVKGDEWGYTPEKQADTTRQVIEKIHDKYPEKTIYVQKILPIKRRCRDSG